MGNTRNDTSVGLIGQLFGMLFGSQFGSAIKYGTYASVTGSLGVLGGIVVWIIKDFKAGALTFVAFAFIALILAVVAGNKQRKALGFGKSQRSTGSAGSLLDEVDDTFRNLRNGKSLLDEGFPPLFGTTPRRPASPRPTTSAPADNCGSAYADPSLHGVDTDCEHSARLSDDTQAGTNGPTFTKSDTGTDDTGGSSTGSSDGGGSSSSSSTD